MPTADAYFKIAWGTHRLWCAAVSTENGRSAIVHELAAGDDHPVQDRGRKAQRVRLSLLFDDISGEQESPTKRFRALKASVDGGKEAIFVHPIDGSYNARPGDFTYEIDDNGTITGVMLELIPSSPIRGVVPASAGTSSASGAGAVAQAASDLDDALAAAFQPPTPITAQAVAAQDAWTSGESVSARQVLTDVAAITNGISALIESSQDDLALWPVFSTAVLFSEAVRAAASAAMAEVASVFSLVVARPTSLLRLCASIYGGAEAEDRQRQAMSLNDIRRPGWIDSGSQLAMPLKTISPRAVL